MQRTTILAFSLLSLGALVPIACTQDFNYYQATSSGGGMTTTSSSSSSGGGTPCDTDTECDDDNRCSVDTCDPQSHRCVYSNQPDGDVPGFMDDMKDCKTLQCVGGQEKSVALDTDIPDNKNPCITVSCDNMTVVTTNVMAGMPCGMPPQQCNGNGQCVGCTKDSDCPDPGDCKVRNCDMQQVCSPTNAMDNTQCNQNGGQVCSMGACVECIDNGDCNTSQSEVCNNNQCQSSCNDNKKDGLETDVDCGGACNTKCAVGKGCMTGADCVSTSKVCSMGTCQAPSCSDTVKNGSETDVDCGGATCAGAGKKCGDGKACAADADCSSGHCNNNVCVNACSDNMKDGMETDVDCGGATCVALGKKCGDGKGCAGDTDCSSGKCMGGTCQMASCNDSVQNGNETDVDCGGGGACPKCPDGDKCNVGSDCIGGFCYVTGGGAGQKTCHANQCADGTKNGNETDVDCGGTTCSKCGMGKACMADTDCVSGSCQPGQKTCN